MSAGGYGTVVYGGDVYSLPGGWWAQDVRDGRFEVSVHMAHASMLEVRFRRRSPVTGEWLLTHSGPVSVVPIALVRQVLDAAGAL